MLVAEVLSTPKLHIADAHRWKNQ